MQDTLEWGQIRPGGFQPTSQHGVFKILGRKEAKVNPGLVLLAAEEDVAIDLLGSARPPRLVGVTQLRLPKTVGPHPFVELN